MIEEGYRIGEVAEMIGVKPYVLRFWETEFKQITPSRTENKQRLYSEKNIEYIKIIQNLLHQQGLTIEGARKIIDKGEAVLSTVPFKSDSSFDKVNKGLENEKIIQELEEMRRLLLLSK
ncbi:MAG: MerR family transcriptional regulator [Desulfovibrionaceae bacterium]